MQVPLCSHWVRGGIVLLVVLVLVVVVLLVPELGSERMLETLLRLFVVFSSSCAQGCAQTTLPSRSCAKAVACFSHPPTTCC